MCNQICMDVLCKWVIFYVEFSCCWLPRILPFSKASLDSTNRFQSLDTAWLDSLCFCREKTSIKVNMKSSIPEKKSSWTIQLIISPFDKLRKKTQVIVFFFFPLSVYCSLYKITSRGYKQHFGSNYGTKVYRKASVKKKNVKNIDIQNQNNKDILMSVCK